LHDAAESLRGPLDARLPYCAISRLEHARNILARAHHDVRLCPESGRDETTLQAADQRGEEDDHSDADGNPG
jgi:hypothetical protein